MTAFKFLGELQVAYMFNKWPWSNFAEFIRAHNFEMKNACFYNLNHYIITINNFFSL